MHKQLKLATGIFAVVGACAFGCETIQSDLNDLTSNFIARTPTEAAEMALDPRDADRRREGTLLLANSYLGGNEANVRMYRDRVLHEEDPIVLAVSIRALAKHGQPSDAILIAEHLDHDNNQVRWEAAKGLQRLHNPNAVPELLTVLRNSEEDAQVRAEAATALGQYPEDRVFQALVQGLNARELSVNLASARSLRTLTGEDLGLDAPRWLTWYEDAEAPFAGRLVYEYPTYTRDETFMEKVTFWSEPQFETPGPPAGLGDADARSTYEDTGESASGEGGQRSTYDDAPDEQSDAG